MIAFPNDSKVCFLQQGFWIGGGSSDIEPCKIDCLLQEFWTVCVSANCLRR